VFPIAEHELQRPGQAVQVLAGVVEVHDLGGLGELAGGDAPDLIPVPRLSRCARDHACVQFVNLPSMAG
ncbi:MAG TPA: hypothetical protein VE733_22750, partial [Streptosporangiaceae bacterium]|nr:hypothetical protein [Streptosporangiaceae bacterium]